MKKLMLAQQRGGREPNVSHLDWIAWKSMWAMRVGKRRRTL